MAQTNSLGAYISKLPPIENRVEKILVSGGQLRADVTAEGILIPRHFTSPVPSTVANSVSFELITSYLNRFEFADRKDRVAAFLNFVGATI